MPDTPRDPHADNDVIDEAVDLPTPSQGGSSGGEMQREIGALDEEKAATGADPQPTSVHKGMKPRSGDEPNLPNRTQTHDTQDRAPPRRTS
jgi:hypothetical protein